ncbi:MAG TPA: ComEC/Rec2 family competence protein [Alphaproteobacteria bacterium]|nr:ComEC/Rec2 family competence protein [Alphaproteobacteria bacterium]
MAQPTATTLGHLRERAESRLARLWGGLGGLFEQERDRWLIWTPVLIGLGVALYFSLPVEPRLSTGVLLFGLISALGLMLRHRPPLARLAAALAMVAGGFLAAEVRTAIVFAPIVDKPVGPVIVSGRVAEVELLEKSARVLLADVSVGGLSRSATPEQVRVRLTPRSDVPRLGERLSLRAKLYAPPTPAAPDAHDFRRDLFYERIGAVGYAVRRFTERPSADDAGAPLLGRLRQIAAERISAVLAAPGDGPERAIALALLVGERGPIPDTVNNQMRDAGLAHLLAISGMNITIAAGLIYFTLRLGLAAIPWIALRLPIKKLAAAGGLLGAIAYTEFVGAPVSAERSMITTSFIMLAIMLDRSALTLRLVAISATLLVAFEPEALMGPSFQMSYAAIVALVVLYERWRWHGSMPRETGALRRIVTYLGGIAVMSVVASAASAVFAIYHFQQSAFYGLGANLIAVPIHDLWIMPWGIASYFLMPFGLEALALKPMGWGIHAMLATAKLFSGFPGAAGHFQAMPDRALALIVIGGLWFLLWTRRWRWLGVAPFAAGVLLTFTARPPDLLISQDGKLVAIRLDSGGIALSNRLHDKFTQSVWVRRAGEGEIEDNPPAALGDTPQAAGCGDGLCRFTVAGRKGAIVSKAEDVAAACAGSDVVIAQIAAHPDCHAPLVVDPTDLARDGAISVRFDNDGPHVETVRETTGERPWTEPARR